MSTVADYLTTLNKQGIRLWVEGEQLRYYARKGALGMDELVRLRTMKDSLIAELRKSPAGESLSFQQQWLHGLARQQCGWNPTLRYAFRITGALRHEALESSLRRVLTRHRILNTRFSDSAGTVRLEMGDPGEFCLHIAAFESGVPMHDGTSERLQEHNRPGLDARLVRVSSEEHILILVFERLAADCLSVGLTLQEIWSCYSEELGESRTPPAQGPQYQDYVTWQQATADQWTQRHASYWTARLQGAERIRWPANDAAADDMNSVLASLQCSFGEVTSTRLRDFGRHTKTLPALTMLTVYVAFICRWCDQHDFVMPFLIAGRHAEQEAVIGYFTHALYLRFQLTGWETFSELLKIVSSEFYRAVFHQDFGRIAANRPQLMGGTLCQWLSWHPAEIADKQPDPTVERLGLTVQNLRLQTPTALINLPPTAVDLEINFFEAADDICALGVYSKKAFGERAMVGLMRGLRLVAEQLALDPGLKLGQLRTS